MFYLFDKKLENLESYDELVLEIHKIHDSRHFFKIFRRRRTHSPPSDVLQPKIDVLKIVFLFWR